MLTSVLMLEIHYNFTPVAKSWTLVTVELDLLLEVVPEMQLLPQHVTILEKRIRENPALGHPDVSFDTFVFVTSRCCSDTSAAVRALQFPQFHIHTV